MSKFELNECKLAVEEVKATLDKKRRDLENTIEPTLHRLQEEVCCCLFVVVVVCCCFSSPHTLYHT